MKIKKGQLLSVDHTRKGKFLGYAKEDFDTDEKEFYPIVLAGEKIIGMNNEWENGEEIPCRNTLCAITIINNR